MKKTKDNFYIENIISKLNKYDTAYYNTGNPLVNDAEYDKIKRRLELLRPNHLYLKKVGAKVKNNEKIRLPTVMGSLDKLRPNELFNWTKKLPKDCSLVITPKFDGLSGCLHYRNGKIIGIYTRGDGINGRVITDKAIYCNGVKKDQFYINGDLIINGEFIIHKSVFNKYFKNSKYKNPRNFVAGILNQKIANKKILNKITFISCGYSYKNDNKYAKNKNKHDQLLLLEQLGFITSRHTKYTLSKIYKKRINIIQKRYGNNTSLYFKKLEELEKYSNLIFYHPISMCIVYNNPNGISENSILNLINEFKQNVDILIDGLVIEVNEHKYRNKLGYEINGLNPSFARAIKLDQSNQDMKIGIVKNINYSFTKRRIYKPTIELKESLNFNGINVTNVYGHNIKYIIDNKIGKNSKIKIIRSGDVIPYIVGIKTNSKKIFIPKRCNFCNTKLKMTKVDLYCPNKNCSGLEYIRLENFFTSLKVDQINYGLIKRIYNNSKFKTIKSFFKIKEKDLINIEGFSTKKSKIVVNNIKTCLHNRKLSEIMYASGYFSDELSGLGIIKLQNIIDVINEKSIINKDNKYSIREDLIIKNKLKKVDGISFVGINLFMNGLHKFRIFYKNLNKYIKLKKLNTTGKLKNFKVCFTGFRDNILQEKIELNGGIIKSSITKDTDVLFVKDLNSTKAKRAKQLKIKTILAHKANDYINNLIIKK